METMHECLERRGLPLGHGTHEPAAYDGRTPRPFLVIRSDPRAAIGVGGRGSLPVGLSTVESLMASAFSFSEGFIAMFVSSQNCIRDASLRIVPFFLFTPGRAGRGAVVAAG